MTPLRWGVLGVANIAVRVVIPALQRAGNGRLVAIASRTAEKARDAAQRLQIPRAHASYEALLADPEVDALYIPLPNSMHREWTTRAAEAGKHVLCEKPLALTAADCVAMIAACRDRGVVLMEAFMYRFHPRTIRVAQLARDGALGEVRLVRASFSFRVLAPENIRLQPALGGGALYDVGCYGVNICRLILGEPRSVAAMASAAPSGVEDVLAATLTFDGDRFAVIDCSLALSRREECEVVGTEGRLTVPAAFLPGTADAEIHIIKGTNRSTETIPGVNQYQLMVEHFADVVAGRTPLTLPPEDAVANLRVIEAALRSARSGHVEVVEP